MQEESRIWEFSSELVVYPLHEGYMFLQPIVLNPLPYLSIVKATNNKSEIRSVTKYELLLKS
jgi:hypothetical protein